MQTNTQALVTIQKLSELPEINLPERTLRHLWHQRKTPGIVLGHKILLFDPSKVRKAIERFEVKAVGQK
jgi:hypothetical protein